MPLCAMGIDSDTGRPLHSDNNGSWSADRAHKDREHCSADIAWSDERVVPKQASLPKKAPKVTPKRVRPPPANNPCKKKSASGTPQSAVAKKRKLPGPDKKFFKKTRI